MHLHFSTFSLRLAALLIVAAFPSVALAQSGIPASAEDPSRNVAGVNNAAGKVVTLNQVDTSAYPDVKLFVTVATSGVPTLGLTATDFTVREDEVLQSPVTVAPKLDPLSLVLTLDTSGSMKEALPVVQASASEFIQNLSSSDEALGIKFSRSVTRLGVFTKDKSQIQEGIKATTARGDTALFDALYSSVEALKGRSGRKAVVLLSDGVDDDGTGKQLSTHSVADVLNLAKEINVPIFTIGLGTGIDEAILKQVAEETGATFNTAPESSQLKALYAGINTQLAGQYSLAYRSNLPADGSSHRVQVSQGTIRGTTKEYLAPATAGVSAVVPTAAAVVAVTPIPASDSGPIPLAGGPNINQATAVEAGVLYESSTGEESPWYKCQLKPGQYVTLWAQNIGHAYSTKVTLHNAKREEKAYQYLNTWQIARFTGLAPADSGPEIYFQIDKKGCAFSAYVSDGSDSVLGSGDVGEDEEHASELQLNTRVNGYIKKAWDESDAYVLKLPAGEYLIKARPSKDLSIKLDLTDLDEGRDISYARSPNAGALTRLTFKLAQAGRVMLTVSSPDGDGGLGRYELIVGAPDVESPPQPSAPKIPERATLRN
jgi:VWFA-related protein